MGQGCPKRGLARSQPWILLSIRMRDGVAGCGPEVKSAAVTGRWENDMRSLVRRPSPRRVLQGMAIVAGLVVAGCASVPPSMERPLKHYMPATDSVKGTVTSYESGPRPGFLGLDFLARKDEHCRVTIRTEDGKERTFRHVTGSLRGWLGNMIEYYGDDDRHPRLRRGDEVEITFFPEKDRESGGMCSTIKVIKRRPQTDAWTRLHEKP